MIASPLSLAFLLAAMPLAYFPGTPMPNRPGCVTTHCESQWFGNMWRRRCHWRCPRVPHYERPPPDDSYQFTQPYEQQPSYTYQPRRYQTADDANGGFIALGVLIAIGLFIYQAAVNHAANSTRHRDTGDVLDDIAETAAARENLNRAAKEADEIIREFKKRSYRDGFEDDA